MHDRIQDVFPPNKRLRTKDGLPQKENFTRWMWVDCGDEYLCSKADFLGKVSCIFRMLGNETRKCLVSSHLTSFYVRHFGTQLAMWHIFYDLFRTTNDLNSRHQRPPASFSYQHISLINRYFQSTQESFHKIISDVAPRPWKVCQLKIHKRWFERFFTTMLWQQLTSLLFFGGKLENFRAETFHWN